MLQFQIHTGQEWINVEAIFDALHYTQVLHRRLRPADNGIKGKIVPDVAVLNVLRTAGHEEIRARVLHSGSPLFTGYVRKQFQVSKRQSLDPVEIELVSPSFLLKKKNTTHYFRTGFKICDPANPSNSLIHDLLIHSGVQLQNVGTLPTIDHTVPVISFKIGELDYHSVLADILFNHGYMFDFDNEGKFFTYELFPLVATPTNAFNGSNCLNRIQQRKREEEYDTVEVKWPSIRQMDNTVVFSDTENGDFRNKCNIIVPPDGYLGEHEGNTSWWAEFGLDGHEFIAAANPTLDFKSHPDVVVEEFTPTPTRALVRIKNTNSVFERDITRLDVKGTAYVQSAVNLSKVTHGSENKVLEVDGQYIFTRAAGDWLASRLAHYYRFSDFQYVLESKTDYPLGSLVLVSDDGLGTITCRIIQKQTDLQDFRTVYTLEAVTEFIPSDTQYERVRFSDPTRVPTTEEIEEGVTPPDIDMEELRAMVGFVALYHRSIETPETPTGNTPEGWYRTVPQGNAPVWMSGANFDLSGNVIGNWTVPTRFTQAETEPIMLLTRDTIFAPVDGLYNVTPTTVDTISEQQPWLSIYENGVNTTELWTIGMMAQPLPGLTASMSDSYWDDELKRWRLGIMAAAGEWPEMHASLPRAITIQVVAQRSGYTLRKTISLLPALRGEVSDALAMESSVTVSHYYTDGTFSPPMEDIFIRGWKLLAFDGTRVPYEAVFKVIVDGVTQYESPVPEHMFQWTDDAQLFPDPELHPSHSLFSIQMGPYMVGKDIQIARVQMWDPTRTHKIDEKIISFVRDIRFQIDDIRDSVYADIEDRIPRYLGRFHGELPPVYHTGDWFLVYDEDDVPFTRGVYKVTPQLTLERLDGDSSGNSRFFVTAIADVLWATSNGYGDLSDYGQITFIPNLAANSIFALALQIGAGQVEGLGDLAQENKVELGRLGTTIIDGGLIKADVIDVQELLGENATFRGNLEASSGLFSGSIESGPLVLNISPPSTSTVTTGGQLASTFIDNLITSGVLPGTYLCTGTYNGEVIDSFTFSRSNPSTVHIRNVQTNFYASWGSFWARYFANWQEHHTQRTYTFTVRRGNTTVYSTGTITQRTRPSSGYTPTHNGVDPNSAWTYVGSIQNGNATASRPSGCRWDTWGSWTSMATCVYSPLSLTAESNNSPTLANGTISLTAGAFTMRLENLPGFNASLPQWTVYLEGDGSGNYNLKVRG